MSATGAVSACSTPRGITGKIALSAYVHDAATRVLNASRHHRKNRMPSTQHNEFLRSAQRLAASQEKSHLGIGYPVIRVLMVLNASRHHRKNRRRLNRSRPLPVCAQRLAASQEKSPAELGHVAPSMCSTPRGITGKIASATRVALSNLRGVLNASRHHRKNRV